MWNTNRRQVTRAGERIGLTYTEIQACLADCCFREPGRLLVPALEISSSSGLPTTFAPPTCGC